MTESVFLKFLTELSFSERKELENVIDQMKTARDKYKEVVNEYYAKKERQGELFPLGREDCRENFKDDIIQYDELVEHCLRAGDIDILQKWGISFLHTREGLRRLASRDIDWYKSTFTNLVDKSNHPLERMCMTILRDTFQALLEDYETVRSLNLD